MVISDSIMQQYSAFVKEDFSKCTAGQSLIPKSPAASPRLSGGSERKNGPASMERPGRCPVGLPRRGAPARPPFPNPCALPQSVRLSLPPSAPACHSV